ncbi:serine--tRNA ligase, mitochondrial-like isoform X2 [Coregonus clupeaformis]|uniref:serine--tRNA ligase, mitochondrial-like isoform X2 n=1 Tax=Coregonus clupeaformis TaxID=59861 RepID=UPI001BE0E31D|nr:serine--tRNA ligase, mitochondrial-like isoform X2 [Coregonus clupeaformis]
MRLVCEETDKVIANVETRKGDLRGADFREIIPEFKEATKEGREIHHRLSQLYPRESELEEEHYGRALRLPNTTHPNVPIGDESQARVVELVGQKPGEEVEQHNYMLSS